MPTRQRSALNTQQLIAVDVIANVENSNAMTIEEFEILLQKPESSNLDFKQCQYEIINDSGNIKTAKFVKDIISFSNTIRTETAFIVIGVGINDDGSKKLIGLNKYIDDSTFQEKVKNKTLPIPYFFYYTFQYSDKTFGIIEIPVKKYSEPISPTINMKGLESGKIYFRRGSSNSEANGREAITINKWMESLPDKIKGESLPSEISQTILKITSNKYPLSECIAQILQIAEKFNLTDLKEFCRNELTGWWNKVPKEKEPIILSYRINKVIVSPHEIEINPYHNLNSTEMINELKKMDGFYEQRFLFSQPISELEKIIKRINEKPNTTLVILKATAAKIFENKELGDIPLKIYANRDSIENIYNGVRQKLIDKLLEIN